MAATVGHSLGELTSDALFNLLAYVEAGCMVRPVAMVSCRLRLEGLLPGCMV